MGLESELIAEPELEIETDSVLVPEREIELEFEGRLAVGAATGVGF